MVEHGNRTVAQVLGEITWLLSQTASHKHLTLGDLEWAVMPAILLNQFQIFYNEKQPVAVAMWALLSEEKEKLLTAQIEANKPARLDPVAWRSGDRLWLLDLVSPFATPENNFYEKLIDQIAAGLFKDKPFRFIRLNTTTRLHELAAMDYREMGNA